MAGDVPRVPSSTCDSSCRGDTPPTPAPPTPAPAGTGTLEACRQEGPLAEASPVPDTWHTHSSALPDPEPGLAGPLHRPDGGSKAQMHRPRPPRGWVLRGRAAVWVSLMIVHAGCLLPVPKSSPTSRYSGTFGTGAPQTRPLLLVSPLGPCIQITHLTIGEKKASPPQRSGTPFLALVTRSFCR